MYRDAIVIKKEDLKKALDLECENPTIKNMKNKIKIKIDCNVCKSCQTKRMAERYLRSE